MLAGAAPCGGRSCLRLRNAAVANFVPGFCDAQLPLNYFGVGSTRSHWLCCCISSFTTLTQANSCTNICILRMSWFSLTQPCSVPTAQLCFVAMHTALDLPLSMRAKNVSHSPPQPSLCLHGVHRMQLCTAHPLMITTAAPHPTCAVRDARICDTLLPFHAAASGEWSSAQRVHMHRCGCNQEALSSAA